MSALPICDRPVGATSGFYGRTGELRRILNCMQRGQSVAVIGGPQVGKTSLLYGHLVMRFECGFSPLRWLKRGN